MDKEEIQMELQESFTNYANLLLWRVVLRHLLPTEQADAVRGLLLDGWRKGRIEWISQVYGVDGLYAQGDWGKWRPMTEDEVTAVLDEFISKIETFLTGAATNE